MALREFRDSTGKVWTAWDVTPHGGLQGTRSGVERRTRRSVGVQPERRSEKERRHAADGATRGWLCFSSGREKRRLFSPPRGWEQLPLPELEDLCRRGTPDRSAARAAS